MTIDCIVGQGRLFTLKDTEERYVTASFEDIVRLAAQEEQAQPCHDDKDHWWAVFTNANHPQARAIRWHRENPGARNTVIWVDIDEGDPPWESVVHAAQTIAQGHEFLIYTSRSHGEAREDGSTKQKYRILFPHITNLPMHAYKHFAKVLNDKVASLGLIPDRATQKASQICYLPNAGPRFQWHWQRGPRIDLGGEHFHWWWFEAQRDFAQAEKERGRKDERSRSPVGAFCRKHDAASMLDLLGFETYDGVNWHWPGQTTSSFGTKSDEDGRGWVTASESVRTYLGRANGDSFDLYARWVQDQGGTEEQALEYAKQCLQAEDDWWFGAATIDHGAKLWAGVDWIDGVAFSDQAKAEMAKQRQSEAAEAQEVMDAAHQAESLKWGGDWVRRVPIPIKPNALEWLAWNAPGVLGEAVRARAARSTRLSLVPNLIGALAALTHIGQGKFVSRRLHHITPVALMLFQVGDSGSGKGDGSSAFYELIRMVDPVKMKAKRVKSFASGQSLNDYLMHHGTDVFIMQNEGGADRKAGKGDKHFESLMAGVTDAYTSFVHGIEITHTKSDEKAASFISHPTVAALMSSTPGKLWDSISNADGESGWLGRNLFLKLNSTATNLKMAESPYPPTVSEHLNKLNEILPPIPNTDHPSVWNGSEAAFHVVHFTEEANRLLDQYTSDCDKLVVDPRRGVVERAIYARAAEAVARVATAASLATPERQIDATIVAWSRLLVEQSLEFVTGHLDSLVGDESGTNKVREAVSRLFERAEAGSGRKWHPSETRRHPDGHLMIQASSVRRRLKDNTGEPARVIKEELQGMIEDEMLVEMDDIGKTKTVKWFIYLPP